MPPRSTIKDIEHTPVPDDPRAWGDARKTLTLIIVSSASMIAGLATTIQNPANAQIEQDLHASKSSISWSLSAFILAQGLFPLVWSAISEIKGRKVVYLSSMSLFIVGSAVVAVSKTIGLVIGMRALQGMGSSAVMAIAAATLADIYEPHERGTKMGTYYAAPLLGTTIGPFLGGVLAQTLGWRAVFWFSLISGGTVLVSLFIFFKDTFRKERSLSCQNALRKRLEGIQLCTDTQTRINIVEPSTNISQQIPSENTIKGLEAGITMPGALGTLNDITLSFRDVNPFPPMILVFKRWNNNAILLASGLIFGFSYSISYTCAGTLSTSYGYDALYTGLVLLSGGVGAICGSTLGGRWSDRMLMKLESQHGEKMHPEMRLQSTLPAMASLPLSALSYAWICQTHQPVAAICVMLFIGGFSLMWIYSSALAYIVDANKGRSSTAVATNSAFRGIIAFIAAEIAIPLQHRIGDGGLYTFWAGLLVITDILVLLVLKFGNRWREKCEEAESKNE
ncbi:major facilitator superfamily domain-containing protein [Boletus coccyginus]|nr:major facilitator superfamily domain-containing protein [Boletus coccyginus]